MLYEKYVQYSAYLLRIICNFSIFTMNHDNILVTRMCKMFKIQTNNDKIADLM